MIFILLKGHPYNYALADLFELLNNWFNGDTDKNDTYGMIRFLWLNRTGTILQFCAGLSIVLEILGKARVEKAKTDIEDVITRKKIMDVFFRWISFERKDYESWRYLPMGFTILFLYGFYRWVTRPEKKITQDILTKSRIYDYKKGLKNHTLTVDHIKNIIIDFKKTVLEFLINHQMHLWMMLVIVVLFFIPRIRYIIKLVVQLPVSLLLLLAKVLAMFIVELLMLQPLMLYLKISKNETHLKIFNFLALIIGFCLSFIFS